MRGVLRGDGRRISFRNDFRDPYRWMRDQMKKRIPGCRGGYPIWLWDKKPDMRMNQWHQGGERIVRLEVEVPDERALLSDFELWHHVLNSWFLGRTGAECEAFRTEFKKAYSGQKQIFAFDEDYPDDLREETMDSWERIFPDRWEELDDSELYGEIPGQLQACVEEIGVDEVVKVEEFITR